MQVLYVTDFEIEPNGEGVSLDDATEETLRHLGRWVDSSDVPVTPEDLLDDGSRSLEPLHNQVARTASWSHLSAGNDWATRVEVRSVAADGDSFSAQVTVGRLGETLRVRVALGREAGGAGISPVTEVELRQPVFVGYLAESETLTIRSGGQLQDGKYIHARTPEVVELIASVLAERKRLPILLLHTRTMEASRAAGRAASRLVGLVRVVTLDYRSARLLRALESRAEVPYAGGLLVWAEIDAPPLVVEPEVVNNQDRDALRALLLEQIAPLSVLTCGPDVVWLNVQRSAQALLAAQAAQRTADAVESGSQSEIIAALTAERDQAHEDARFATEQWEQADALAERRAKVIARLSAQVEQLRIAAKYQPTLGTSTAEAPTFENAPKLTVGDQGSLDALAKHLEQAAEGRIVFTPRALAAWNRADRYATPDEMHDSLVKLARVAHDLYDGTERSMGHLDKWIRENYDLKVSLVDDQMPKPFRSFEWEGMRYDRTPHVKVNDGVPHHECGRVYFALDRDGNRILVDHVGIKY